MARELHDAALRREVSAQDREPARGLERRLDGDDDLLAFAARRRPPRPRRACGRRRSARRRGRAPPSASSRATRATPPASCMSVATKRPPGFRLATTGVRSANALEVLELEGDLELAGDREQVEDAVRRAAGGRDRGGRVLERLARDDLRGADVLSHELHRESPRLLGRLVLRRVERRDPVEAAGADAEELEGRGHRVRGELASAGACARARDALELVQVGRVSVPAACAPTASKTSMDRHVAGRGTGPARSSRCRGRAPAGRAGRAP